MCSGRKSRCVKGCMCASQYQRSVIMQGDQTNWWHAWCDVGNRSGRLGHGIYSSFGANWGRCWGRPMPGTQWCVGLHAPGQARSKPDSAVSTYGLTQDGSHPCHGTNGEVLPSQHILINDAGNTAVMNMTVPSLTRLQINGLAPERRRSIDRLWNHSNIDSSRNRAAASRHAQQVASFVPPT